MMAKAVQENYADQPHVEAQVAMLIANQAADNDNQVSIQQVRQQLEEEYPLAVRIARLNAGVCKILLLQLTK